MINFKSLVFCSVSTLLLMTACTTSPSHGYASNGPSNAYVQQSYMGNVSSINIVSASSHTSGGGAILGAVIGGAIGSQIGGGNGRTAATVAGVVGGAVAGNAIESHNKSAQEIYRVSVRFDNGSVGQYDYQNINDLRVGDRVKVESGQIYRM